MVIGSHPHFVLGKVELHFTDRRRSSWAPQAIWRYDHWLGPPSAALALWQRELRQHGAQQAENRE
jgi:hypothetical protein